MIATRKSPLLIAHRGASTLAPENTLAAFALALRAGADGLEFDVRLSGDGVPVVIHDATLNRTGDRREAISTLSMAELEKVDVGSWFNRRFPRRARAEYAKERLPSLEQLFAAVSDNDCLLYLELKSDDQPNPDLVARVSELILEYKIRERVIIESFTLENLELFRRTDPHIKTAALFEPKRAPLSLLQSSRLIKRALAVQANEIALHHSVARRRIVTAARAAGLEVVVWTVDRPAWIARARRLDVKALITNRPAHMLHARATAD